MAKASPSSVCSYYFLFFLSLLVCDAAAAAELPGIFIFGDSTFDVGTNNHLPKSLARANFLPNGIDFPYSVPTGRFSNGLNTADQIVRVLGYEKSPRPFLSLLDDGSTFKRNILQGVNFASGGSGILNHTGFEPFKDVVALGKQIEQFEIVHGILTEIIGEKATSRMLANSLFIISVGSNDFFEFNKTSTTRNLSIEDYMSTLQSTYHDHLQNLFNLGARKFGILGVPPIGCCPARRPSSGSEVCEEELNEFARTFNNITEVLLQNLSSELVGMKYSLGNTYRMISNILEDPLLFGFKNITSACCGGGKFNGERPCAYFYNPILCRNHDEYLFWDLFHPTEAVSKLAALTLFAGGTSLFQPLNFSVLVAA
ncbi:hypothetical protein UlMin_039678 [Ulmus minor]